MLRLSIKDLRIYWVTFAVNFVFWTLIAPASLQNPDIYLMMPIGFAILINMIPLGNDIRDGKDLLYASLPVKRQKIVLARYLSSFILTILAFIWLLLLGLVFERYLPGLKGSISGQLSADSIIIMFLLITLIICIYLPLVYKFGFGAVITGGIAVTAAVIAGFWAVASFLISSNSGMLGLEGQQSINVFNIMINNNLFRFLSQIINNFGRAVSLIVIFLIIAAAIVISISISIRIFSRKEL